MRCKIFAFLIVPILWSGMAYAQTDQRVYDLQNVVPPSPNAASLGEYANWPVNLYTGVPEINIPLYELKGRNLSIPISLSYHASGIKVGENASPVGLGWSLMAGGVVTRSVRGLADDDGAGYLTVRGYYNNPGDLSSGTMASGTSAYSDSMLQLSIAKGDEDSEPDLYMFSALGRSYKFYFSGSGTIVTQPYSNLKITVDWTNNNWTVVLEDGTKLLFGGGTNFIEQTTTNVTNVEPETYTSAWYLKSVTSANGEVINFTYANSPSVTLDSYFYQADYLYDNTAVNNYSHGSPTTIKAATSRAQTQNVGMLYPATIESDLCKIIFDTSNSRADLPGAALITGMHVYSKQTSAYLKSYKFFYTYSSAVSGNVYSGGYTTPLYRLKLDSLEEIPSDNSPAKYWQFNYNPNTLPSRKSLAQDWWGYFNGATTNTNMLPYETSFNPYTYTTANRSADSASMMAEMLTKITYPTGGYSQFTYEPNSYPNSEEQFQNASGYMHLYMTSGQSPFVNSRADTFTITKAQYFKYQFTGVFSSAYSGDYGPATVLATATLKNSSGTTVSAIPLKSANSGTAVTSILYLSAGTYTLTMSSISSSDDFPNSSYNVDLSSTFYYTASLGYKAVNHPLGGVRIQSIFDFDGVDTSKTIKKYYQYENAEVVYTTDTANDYLSLTTDNMYDCEGTLTSCGAPCLASSVVYYTRTASTKFSLGSIQGGTVGYGKVTEKFGPNGENGKNVYYYSYAGDLNLPSSKGFPYPETISMDYERGLLQEQDAYTSGGVLVAKTKNSYQFTQRNAINTYKVAYKFNILSDCYTFSFLSQVLNRIYYQDLTNQVEHLTSTQTSYNTATGDSLSVTTNYYYDDTLNMQPVRTVSVNSKGDTVLAYSRTALEKADINSSIVLTATASTAIDTLKVRNMVGIPIESEKYTKGVLTNKALTNYKVQAGSGLVLPDNVMLQNASNTIETRLLFNRYNSKGDLAEQQKSSGEKHSYIWDYSGTYPVAEVVNADSANIAYTSFESDGTGNWSVGSASRDATKGITGNLSYLISNGAITKSGLTSGRNYVVSYWTTNASAYSSITGNKSGYPIQGKTITVNGTSWHYFEHKVTGLTSLSISGTGNIDELRLYPDTALMTTYTYAAMAGITSQCDANNRITYYQYDGLQRLSYIMDQDRNVLKKYCYAYNGQVSPCIASGSGGSVTVTGTNYTGVSGFSYVYTNVGTGTQYTFALSSATGTQTLGTVPAGTYNISISKSGNTSTYVYYVCSTGGVSGTSATFNNIPVSTSDCNYITLDTTF